jgi:hypothetical protein
VSIEETKVRKKGDFADIHRNEMNLQKWKLQERPFIVLPLAIFLKLGAWKPFCISQIPAHLMCGANSGGHKLLITGC